MPRTAVLIVAAGKGERAGLSLPKQYEFLAGQPMLRRTAEAFSGFPLAVVIGPGQEEFYHRSLPGGPAPVSGGPRRQDSVRLGLESLEAMAPDFVLIHDAARPLVSRQMIDAVIAALERGAGGAAPMLAVADTLRRWDVGGRQDSGQWRLVPRDGLFRAQTPQGFRFADILAAHRTHAAADVTDDVEMAALAGIGIEAVAGEETNLKVTTEKDFTLASKLIGSLDGRSAGATQDSSGRSAGATQDSSGRSAGATQDSSGRSAGATQDSSGRSAGATQDSSGRSAGATLREPRTAMGYDAHRFTDGDHVWLCGVKIAHDHGLLGHSDADAGLHALTDAILGCIGAGDIGQHFPPSDERWRGAASDRFLAHAAALVAEKGGRIVHCDVTLICERPKIGPHREAMRTRIAEILHLDIERVSVKATTTEGMGYTGRREGLAAQAVATVLL